MKEYLEKLVKQNVFPGCNYAIITENGIEMNSVGNKSLIPKIEKNSIDTLYDLASLTKVIATNTIITKLLQENKIKLTDYVKEYLPKFKYNNITIYHLLTHTSGLIADVKWDNVHNKEELIDFFYNKELFYKTESDVIYSDLNFIFLGFIIEKIYNLPFEKIVYKEVLEPLKMSNTCFNPQNKEMCAPTEVTDKRGVVRGIVHDEKACMLNGICGAAGLFSNIEDIVKFILMILNDGKIGNKQFIKKEYIDLWFKPLVKGKQKNVRSIGWGIGKSKTTGWLCSDNTIYHTGFTGNTLIIDRDNKIGFIFLSNRIHPTRKNKLLLNRRKYIANQIFKKIKQVN